MSYGSPSPGPLAKDPPEARLRALLRKAFLDVEKALADWDEASEQGLQVLRALTNAGDRLRDFSANRGHLGMLSRIPGAEDELRTRLIMSMERLHRALHPQVAALATVCEKLGNIFDSTLQQSLELQAECDPDSLWDSKYDGQPCIGEMLEWLEDCFIAAGREHALRELLMREVGSEEGMHRALDLWESQIWLDDEQVRTRLDIVRIHGS